MPRFHLLALLFLALGCSSSTVGPDEAQPEIRLRVTEGFAGVDYTVVLEGAPGTLVGEECVSFCDFRPGEVIRTLSPDQVTYLAELFLDAGIHGFDGTDFGRECCDQFHFEVDYRDPLGSSQVQGSSEAFPGKLRTAVSALHGLISGTIPLVVNFETRPDRWPRDPVEILDGEVSGDFLDLRVSYGGGCEIHDIKAVAWGGWMESFPVQVRVFLSHDDRNDPCDALITQDLRFDLRPLRDAYVASYGSGDPGSTTVAFGVDMGLPAFSSRSWFFEYVF
jgi:hypothetical protein